MQQWLHIVISRTAALYNTILVVLLPYIVGLQIYSPSFPLAALLFTPHAEVRAWRITIPMRKLG